MYFIKNKAVKNVGGIAEDKALAYLKNKGLTLSERNFHSRFGEIDLIMREQNTLVFVEVRCRKINAQVSAVESISPQKIKKIIKTAEYYIMSLDKVPDCRFDVIAMTHNPHNSAYTIDWLKQAF